MILACGASFVEPEPLFGADQDSPQPSFDCAKATSNVERAICDAPELAALDRQMAALHAQWIDLPDPQRRAATQRSWMSARDSCGALAAPHRDACLDRAYTWRVSALAADLGLRFVGTFTYGTTAVHDDAFEGAGRLVITGGDPWEPLRVSVVNVASNPARASCDGEFWGREFSETEAAAASDPSDIDFGTWCILLLHATLDGITLRSSDGCGGHCGAAAAMHGTYTRVATETEFERWYTEPWI